MKIGTTDFVFIVLRESADGPEQDVFKDLDLARKWEKECGGTMIEESVIDAETLEAMTKAYRAR